ncbi:hypothetical protein SEPCBS57363_002765 [Sporothrix epigloea]|uniref:C6 zinc finger domain containing protein n=1 Tax=Sporothrix epigloea TaxID=1892477 RepID=A0ABP0DL86_9PEZI
MGTGTSAASPATQLTPSTGSPEPETLQLQTAFMEPDHSVQPSCLQLFDQFAVPIPDLTDLTDLHMGTNISFVTPQRVLPGSNVFPSNVIASTRSEGSWAGDLFADSDVAVPSRIPTLDLPSIPKNLENNVGSLLRSGFSRQTPFRPAKEGFAADMNDGLAMPLQGERWMSRQKDIIDLSLGTPLRQPFMTDAQTSLVLDSNTDETSSDANASSVEHSLSPASKALQLISHPAQQANPSLSTVSLNDFSTVLVEFYFKVTAQLYSCYDSRMNPFRSAVVRTWSSSRIIYCTLQSMAAASLIGDFPQVAPIGRQLRQEAATLLAKTTSWDINSMLAILMLGGTSSWHNARDLGLPFFNQIATCLATAPPSVFTEAGGHRSYRFFRESMLYWEMLLAFVADNDTISSISAVPNERPHSGKATMGPKSLPERHIPHPWTGFCAETQLAVVKVGRLIRRQRKFDCAHRFASQAHINQLKRDMLTAKELEERLVNIAHPSEQSVQDTEDRNTPVWHLLTLAEIIRDAGLVQLYHVFPDLLTTRLQRERRKAHSSYSDLGAHFQDDQYHDYCASDEPEITQEERSKWLTAYTLRSLEKMKTIPIESGTRDFQPFLLVALCSELRINKKSPTATEREAVDNAGIIGTGANLPLHMLLNIDMETVEVTRARGFIHSRLTAFLHALPPRPILACLDIVKQTWVEMDRQAVDRAKMAANGLGIEGDADVYWVDVMIQNGWETIMA